MIETEITDRVNALTAQDWSELEVLYERVVRHTGSFSEMGGGQEIEKGVIEMPYTIEKPIVSEVRRFFLDKHLIVMFDWSHWNEGKAMFKVSEAERFKGISLEDTVKMFTAVMRNDRFCDGAWADLFENGDSQRLLKRLLAFKPVSLHS